MICDICDVPLARSIEGLKHHVKRVHGMDVPFTMVQALEAQLKATTHEPIKPVRTTNRTKAEIVKSWEAANPEVFKGVN